MSQLAVPVTEARAPRRAYQVSAGRALVSAAELVTAQAEIIRFQRVLNKKTLENEIFKQAMEYTTEKIGFRHNLC
jgi:hypothetical protein